MVTKEISRGALFYSIVMLGLILLITGCRTKKSSVDSHTKEAEKVLIVDNSVVKKTLTTQENNISSTTSNSSDKSFFESWMSFESDKITIMDIHGTKTEIMNPKINKKDSKTNDVSKVEQTDTKSDKLSKKEENEQSDLTAEVNKETQADFHSKDNRETKIVWLYWIGGAVLAISFMFLVNKIFKKSN